MNTNLLAIDISKSIFHVVELGPDGQELMRKALKRNKFLSWIARREPTLICMEACSTSNYWARKFQELGFEVRLIPAQFAKPFLQGNKNDFNDALAIGESANRPKMHAVPVKTIEQQDQQSIRRIRSQLVAQRTAVVNQTRGLMAEYGLVMSTGVAQFKNRVPELLEDAENELSTVMREALARQYEYFSFLNEQIKHYDKQLNALVTQDEDGKRLLRMPGIGPKTASAFLGYVGDGKRFDRGRDVSASVGLVPKQCTSADKHRLLGMSKRGAPELRYLLICGARSYLKVAGNKQDRLSRWAVQLAKRVGHNKAVVGLANKMARIAWALIRKQKQFDANFALAA